jgi:hypothetical protein
MSADRINEGLWEQAVDDAAYTGDYSVADRYALQARLAADAAKEAEPSAEPNITNIDDLLTQFEDVSVDGLSEDEKIELLSVVLSFVEPVTPTQFDRLRLLVESLATSETTEICQEGLIEVFIETRDRLLAIHRDTQTYDYETRMQAEEYRVLLNTQNPELQETADEKLKAVTREEARKAGLLR